MRPLLAHALMFNAAAAVAAASSRIASDRVLVIGDPTSRMGQATFQYGQNKPEKFDIGLIEAGSLIVLTTGDIGSALHDLTIDHTPVPQFVPPYPENGFKQSNHERIEAAKAKRDRRNAKRARDAR